MKKDVGEIARAFERFVDSGYEQKRFTKDLYEALRMSFGFIAHYDRGGFYQKRFSAPEDRVVTFAEIRRPTAWPARPIEVALRKIVVRRELHEQALKDVDAAVEKRERAELARLKAKYEGQGYLR